LIAVLATRAAQASGAKEALIVDRNGRVLEGSTSNVFAVVAGVVVTAPEELGVLAGVTRSHVLELMREQGIRVELRALSVPELAQASEVFITSSIREIVPVVQVDGKSIGSGRPGPLATGLLGPFRERATKLAKA
jgi:branched-subunit amino acid aminotransferase/4-amino-4-deoxychorismate lyase